MDYNKMALKMHKDNKGKLTVNSKVKVSNKDDLSTAYTPGVAQPCREIHKNPAKVYEYTSKGNLVAVVTDGTAVLGLGDIGPEASIPVMEGKAVLFKEFGNVDAFPICVKSKSVEEIVKTVELIEPMFGGINLEDIAAPRCFEIEKRLKESLDIPVFHDDQHGTAIVVLAAIINSIKLIDKSKEELEIVINGAGSAGIAIAKLLLSYGVKNIVMCDRNGILDPDTQELNDAKFSIAQQTNINNETGDLATALKSKDVFIGVSAPNLVTAQMISTMNDQSIVLPMANPIPEIMPEDAKKGGAYIIGTGRSDFPNQVNNVLAFPGIFRGALDARAKDINEEMKIAAAIAIAETLSENELSPEQVLPLAFDARICKNVSKAVYDAAVRTKVARVNLTT